MCLEGNTISNPVHTSETRMCGDDTHRLSFLPGRQYIARVGISCTALQAGEESRFLSEGIFSFVEYALGYS